MKTYLGDGVYVEIEDFRTIKLTVNNGIRDTDTIYLERDTWECLKLVVEKAEEEK
jgi:hypothetical protein